MPEEGKDDIVEFKNHANAHRHPLIIAADFETLLIGINQKISKTSQEIKKKQHLISSASFCSVGAINEFKLFRGENCLDHFIKLIEELINNYNSIIQKYPKIQITKVEACKHYHQTKCWICDGEFNNKVVMSKKGNEWKPYIMVIDHNHITGKYLGAAHNDCNLRRTTKVFIPIYFHNLSRYDSHLMLNVINKFGTGNIKVIPHTEEEYISFSKTYKIGNRDYESRFLDSYRLMPESLDELSSNLLAKGQTHFNNLLKFTSPAEQEVIFWNECINIDKTETIINKEWNGIFKHVKSTLKKPRIKGI